MLDKKLKEALDLLGGKAVIKDQDQYYVILSLSEFKKIKKEGIEGLTKQELVDKINNDIASWKVMQEEEKIEDMDLSEISETKSEEIRYEKAD
jgi:DNA primase large subunit